MDAGVGGMDSIVEQLVLGLDWRWNTSLKFTMVMGGGAY